MNQTTFNTVVMIVLWAGLLAAVVTNRSQNKALDRLHEQNRMLLVMATNNSFGLSLQVQRTDQLVTNDVWLLGALGSLGVAVSTNQWLLLDYMESVARMRSNEWYRATNRGFR